MTLFKNSSRHCLTAYRNSIICLMLVMAMSSCQKQTKEQVERSKNLDTAFNQVVTALQDPSLHTLAQQIEEVEYTPDGILSVMFSAFGAGTWPPPSLPSDIKILRNQPLESWAVVITTDPKGFTVIGYSEETENAAHKKQIAFPPPTQDNP
jgi:hypothetical protein